MNDSIFRKHITSENVPDINEEAFEVMDTFDGPKKEDKEKEGKKADEAPVEEIEVIEVVTGGCGCNKRK